VSTLWFWTLAAMLAVYAVLDGYDLGVGALHLGLARTPTERSVHFQAIGPVWNGNEVWLIAAGGMIFAAFPRLYAAAFSGFYLALMVVLWLFILRGVAIEFRHQISHPLWSEFWDAVFALASLLLALLLGVALGNLVRGLPVGPDGYFQGSFALLLNPYAMLVGLLSLVVLAWHGAEFIRGKSAGAHAERARRFARILAWVAAGLGLAATAATLRLRPAVLENFERHPLALLLPAAALAGWLVAWRAPARRGFAGSSLVILGLIGAAAATLYPDLLPSSLDPHYSLTVHNAAAGAYALRAAWIANIFAVSLVAVYSIHIHARFRGPAVGGQGYEASGIR